MPELSITPAPRMNMQLPQFQNAAMGQIPFQSPGFQMYNPQFQGVRSPAITAYGNPIMPINQTGRLGRPMNYFTQPMNQNTKNNKVSLASLKFFKDLDDPSMKFSENGSKVSSSDSNMTPEMKAFKGSPNPFYVKNKSKTPEMEAFKKATMPKFSRNNKKPAMNQKSDMNTYKNNLMKKLMQNYDNNNKKPAMNMNKNKSMPNYSRNNTNPLMSMYKGMPMPNFGQKSSKSNNIFGGDMRSKKTSMFQPSDKLNQMAMKKTGFLNNSEYLNSKNFFKDDKLLI